MDIVSKPRKAFRIREREGGGIDIFVKLKGGTAVMKSESIEISNKSKLSNRVLTVVFSVISVIYVLPIVIVINNHFYYAR